MVYTLLFFPPKCSLFHNSNVFGFCIIQILYTGCAKIEKNNSVAKRVIMLSVIKIIEYSLKKLIYYKQYIWFL